MTKIGGAWREIGNSWYTLIMSPSKILSRKIEQRSEEKNNFSSDFEFAEILS